MKFLKDLCLVCVVFVWIGFSDFSFSNEVGAVVKPEHRASKAYFFMKKKIGFLASFSLRECLRYYNLLFKPNQCKSSAK